MIIDRIREAAKALDDAVEKQDVEEVLAYFCDDCDIELLGVTLSGKAGLRKALGWMFRYFKEISFTPVTIMIEGSAFFEEFIFRAKSRIGKDIETKQAEVLIYDPDYQVRSLRLYFDRLELADATASNVLERIALRLLIRASTKELLQR
jgi:ketosteroid isomerase-like protein